jgi:hypothetical protein
VDNCGEQFYRCRQMGTVNIIYDSRRFEKYEPLMNELVRQDIVDYKIWDCVMLPSVVESINASHKMIIRNAKENGDKECIIWEDDCWIPAADGWEYFLKNKPNDFDIYIGGTYSLNEPDVWKPPLQKVNNYVGNHCIIVHEKYYDRFLSVGDKLHIDTAQEGLGDFYVCFPFAAIQRPGFSANNPGEKVNYNTELKERYVYGKFK